MSTINLTPSSLRATTIGDPSWDENDTWNWQRMYNTLLNLSEILDVDVTGISDGDVLSYNSSSQKYEALTPPYAAYNTTTTTTTTTSTTTTTTTTTV